MARHQERFPRAETLDQLKRQYELILASAAEGICGVDAGGRITFINPAGARILSYQPDEAVGRDLHDLIHRSREDGSPVAKADCPICRSIAAGEPYLSSDEAFRKKDGRFVPVECHCAPMLDGDAVNGAVLIFRDISGRIRARRVRERLLAIVEETSDFVSTADAAGRVSYLNKAARRLLGAPEDEAIAGMLIKDVHPEWAHRLLCEEGLPTAAKDGVWNGETALLSRDGREIPVLQTVVAHKNENGSISHYSTIARDITDRKRMEERLLHYARHDPLTGLKNRRGLEEKLCEALEAAAACGGLGALMYIDLDNLKDVNDGFGHRAGDLLLSELSRLLRSRLPKDAIVARIGGDEFAAYLPGAGRERAQAAAEDILEAFRRNVINYEGDPLSATASVGIALYPDHGRTDDELMANADAALYRVKRSGRDDVAVYSPQSKSDARTSSRFAWDMRLRDALENDGFLIYCQPVLDLRTDAIAHYEALLRLKRDGDIHSPGAFLPAAEETGWIRAIDRHVVRRVLQLSGRLRRRGRPVKLALNLSGKTIGDFEILNLIRDEIRAHDVDPASLIFEITERVAITELGQAKEFVLALKELGVGFALDDFGVGFSSFESLKELPFDYVKIDGSFIRGIADSDVDQRLVEGMVEVAHGTGKMVVAEYVEDARSLFAVRAMGVDFAQGYYIGEPRSVSQVFQAEVTAGPR